MHVVAGAPSSWFLLEHDGALYLDVNCQHSAVGFSVFLRLSEEEARRYREGGEPFVSRLARSVADLPSAYRERDVDGSALGGGVTEAIVRWRASGAAPPA